MSIWDLQELSSDNEYVNFVTVGDTVTGVLTQVGVKKWDDGNISPQLYLHCPDGSDRVLTAGQIRLKSALVEQRPEAGDTITVTLTNIEKRAGGKTLKHFDVKVVRGDGAPATAAPVAQAAAPAAVAAPVAVPVPVVEDPTVAAAQAALAGLTPAQRAALGL